MIAGTTRLQKNIAVAQLGARHHYAIPSLLNQQGALRRFYTDFYLSNRSIVDFVKYLSIGKTLESVKTIKSLISRQEPTIPGELITAFRGIGIAYAVSLRLARTIDQKISVGLFFARAFARKVADSGLSNIDTIYGMNLSSYEFFRKARANGISCVLEQISAPRATEIALISRMSSDFPEWPEEEPSYIANQSIADREREEWANADLIISGSQFVRNELIRHGVNPTMCRVVPYFSAFSRDYKSPERSRALPLKIAFVGNVSLKKGIGYLFRALDSINSKNIYTRAIGPINVCEKARKTMAARIEFRGHVHWQDIRKEYNWADVFVFPSICEGSAQVTYEALSQSLPVITTPNAGSIVRDGIEGFIVPAFDSETLAARIEFIMRNPSLRKEMSVHALNRSFEFGLERYGTQLMTELASLR